MHTLCTSYLPKCAFWCLNDGMPDLKQSLLGCDLGHLHIIAEHWGVHMDVPDTRTGIPELAAKLLDEELIAEIIEALSEDALRALSVLQNNNGRIPWSQFTRRFGVVREMGSGRRDRERPDRDPVSTAEVLWYRALVARAFFDTARGTEEFAYIPDDLMPLMTTTSSVPLHAEETPVKILGRVATAAERALPTIVTDRILDHTCTLLAGLRAGVDWETITSHMAPYTFKFIRSLANQVELLNASGHPVPKATGEFLESPRGEALALLAATWMNSREHNDLHHVPGLQPEGEWTNDPLRTRKTILNYLSAIPRSTWWSISAFIADLHQHNPDFQRPAGDYDSWYLRDTHTGEFLRGYEHWNDVDGALIRYLITGPLHWLGILDLAAPEEDAPATAFRFSKWAGHLTKGDAPTGMSEENARIHVRSDGRVSLPLLVPRAARYQLARFCLWEDPNLYEFRYRIVPSSLAKARDSGLGVNHLLALLQRYADAVPPNIITALNRWVEHGTEVRIQDATILRLSSPQVLKALRASKAARFLGDPLGPVTIIVKPGAGESVLAALVEMGHLGEII
jgi:hypothetical protein